MSAPKCSSCRRYEVWKGSADKGESLCLNCDNQRAVKRTYELLDAEREAYRTWQAPIPLVGGKDLPRFPDELLPSWLGGYVRAVAAFTQTPTDLAGLLALSAIGAVLAKRVEVEVRRNWSEPVNIYTVVGLPTGERKSAVFRLMLAPVEALERSLIAEWAPRAAEARAKRQVAEDALKAARKDARDGADNLDALVAAEAALAEAVVPPAPRLLADDVTQEALASLLAESGGRIGVFSPEGGIFEILAGRYSEGRPNIELFLKGYSGDALRVDRKGRGPEHIDAPAITLGLTVQPCVIAGLAAVRGFRDRGLLARILYALPNSRVGYRASRPLEIDPGVERRYYEAITALGSLQPHSADTADIALRDSNERPHRLQLEVAALERLEAFHDEVEVGLRPDGALSTMADWANRLPGTVVRLAGTFHMAEHGIDGIGAKVEATTMESAIAFARYLTPHATASFELMGADPVIEGAKRVLAWIGKRPGEPFSQREAFNALRGTFPKVEALRRCLDVLVDHGYVVESVPDKKTGPGRRASPVFQVNPLAQYPQYPHNANGVAPASAVDELL